MRFFCLVLPAGNERTEKKGDTNRKRSAYRQTKKGGEKISLGTGKS